MKKPSIRRAMSRKGLYGLASKAAGEVAAINWYPGHMASATKAIRERIKVVDLVVEVRDARVSHRSLLLLLFLCIFMPP